jgi:Flp pilus assembly protein TadB
MISSALNLLTLIVLGAIGAKIIHRNANRNSRDVLEDLRDEKLFLKDILSAETDEIVGQQLEERVKKSNTAEQNEALQKAGVFDPERRRRIILWNNLIPVILGLVIFGVGVFNELPFGTLFILVSMSMGLGAIYSRRKIGSIKKQFNRDLVFFLPIVMERIVMAVQAGLDIVPAIKTATKFGGEGLEVDPVTSLLRRVITLTESGMIFESALKDVASNVESSPLRHAFLHLAVAQKEGGVLIMPLRELSDSTQLFYQESIEEEIAEMPVKATLPLICTFAGLLLCFLVPPFLQVISILIENAPGAK